MRVYHVKEEERYGGKRCESPEGRVDRKRCDDLNVPCPTPAPSAQPSQSPTQRPTRPQMVRHRIGKEAAQQELARAGFHHHYDDDKDRQESDEKPDDDFFSEKKKTDKPWNIADFDSWNHKARHPPTNAPTPKPRRPTGGMLQTPDDPASTLDKADDDIIDR